MAYLELPEKHDDKPRYDPETDKYTSSVSIYSDPDVLDDLIHELTDITNGQLLYSYGACGAVCYGTLEEIIGQFKYVQDVYNIDRRGGKRAYREVLRFEDVEIQKNALSLNDLWILGLRCCKQYFDIYGYQALFAVRYDSTGHGSQYYIDFIINSVSYVDGRKWSTTPQQMFNRDLCFKRIIQDYLYERNNGSINGNE